MSKRNQAVEAVSVAYRADGIGDSGGGTHVPTISWRRPRTQHDRQGRPGTEVTAATSHRRDPPHQANAEGSYTLVGCPGHVSRRCGPGTETAVTLTSPRPPPSTLCGEATVLRRVDATNHCQRQALSTSRAEVGSTVSLQADPEVAATHRTSGVRGFRPGIAFSVDEKATRRFARSGR